jgi:hypothetical protein
METEGWLSFWRLVFSSELDSRGRTASRALGPGPRKVFSVTVDAALRDCGRLCCSSGVVAGAIALVALDSASVVWTGCGFVAPAINDVADMTWALLRVGALPSPQEPEPEPDVSGNAG